jgi:hypothetical protein
MTITQVQALLQTKVSVSDPNEFTAFWGLRLGRKKMGREKSLPSRLATRDGAQVALQHCPILRPSASILSLDSLWRHNIYCVYLGEKRADLTALVFC